MSCSCNIQQQVDAIIARIGSGPDKAIPLLQAVQNEFRYIPLEAIERIAARTEMTETRLYGVATFYSQFRLQPVGETIIKVCHGTACHVAGAEGVTETIEKWLNIADGENHPGRQVHPRIGRLPRLLFSGPGGCGQRCDQCPRRPDRGRRTDQSSAGRKR